MKKIGLALIAVLVIIQFFGIDKETPMSDPKSDFIAIHTPPTSVANMLKTSCYDCHSYETKYPWYTNVAPLSWWIGHHIEEGREELNLSEWSKYPQAKALHKLEEMYEEVEHDEMPLSSYLWVHSEAALTDEQKEEMVAWIKSIPSVEDEH
ncbi:heme-binding domain-containing protein [Reichenbachiella versicolor]|uniref:heme-binding domain-containing protein n=1 Tax=Reichenbachiella versicolor TaxID=1821036 RepID=UPI001FE3AC19|nr:heme-binding domain-containing protein [Reichenbachiella versicolor]